jgi:hypothetical protein
MTSLAHFAYIVNKGVKKATAIIFLITNQAQRGMNSGYHRFPFDIYCAKINEINTS